MSDKPKDWITVNGAHVPLDEEGGLTGKVGEKIARESGEAKPDGEKATEKEETQPENGESRQEDQPEDSDAGEAEEGGEATEPEDEEGEEDESSPPGKNFAFYREMADSNAFKGARLFFRNELQDTAVEPKNGPLAGKSIGFIGADWTKFKQNMNRDEVKAEAIQYVPDVIRDGRCFGPVEPFDKNRGGGRFKCFYYFQKDIPMKDENGKPRRLIVDVGETKEGELVYLAHSFQHNQSFRYQLKRDELRELGFPVEDKKRADCQLRIKGGYPCTADPPGGIFLHSGHRPSAPEKRIDQAGAFDKTLHEEIVRGCVTAIMADLRKQRDKERAAAMDALDPAGMRTLEIRRFQDELPTSGPFAGLRNITVARQR